MPSINFKTWSIALGFAIWIWSPGSILTQDFLDLKIPEFEVKEATMEDALKKLRAWGVQVCLEKVPEMANESSEGRITLKMSGASIREILDALTSQDRRYYWERYHSVLTSGETNLINVLPLGAKEDKDNLMNIRSRRVEVNAEPVKAISYIRRFVPELRAELARRFPGGFVVSELGGVIGAPWVRKYYVHLILEDVTVREVLNEIALRSGEIWVYESHPSYQWKTFF